jgi:hypothetical protein
MPNSKNSRSSSSRKKTTTRKNRKIKGGVGKENLTSLTSIGVPMPAEHIDRIVKSEVKLTKSMYEVLEMPDFNETEYEKGLRSILTFLRYKTANAKSWKRIKTVYDAKKKSINYEPLRLLTMEEDAVSNALPNSIS